MHSSESDKVWWSLPGKISYPCFGWPSASTTLRKFAWHPPLAARSSFFSSHKNEVIFNIFFQTIDLSCVSVEKSWASFVNDSSAEADIPFCKLYTWCTEILLFDGPDIKLLVRSAKHHFYSWVHFHNDFLEKWRPSLIRQSTDFVAPASTELQASAISFGLAYLFALFEWWCGERCTPRVPWDFSKFDRAAVACVVADEVDDIAATDYTSVGSDTIVVDSCRLAFDCSNGGDRSHFGPWPVCRYAPGYAWSPPSLTIYCWGFQRLRPMVLFPKVHSRPNLGCECECHFWLPLQTEIHMRRRSRQSFDDFCYRYRGYWSQGG